MYGRLVEFVLPPIIIPHFDLVQPYRKLSTNNLKIEVKGRGKDKKPHVFLNQHNIEALENADDNGFRLYAVMNPVDNPKLIIFTKEEIITKKEKRRQWKIPLRKTDFDKGIPLK